MISLREARRRCGLVISLTLVLVEACGGGRQHPRSPPPPVTASVAAVAEPAAAPERAPESLRRIEKLTPRPCAVHTMG